MKSPRRLAAWLRRELLRRRTPHGLLGLRYLMPGGDPRVAEHRALWWSSKPSRLPRSLWLLLELGLLARWLAWEAWAATARTLRASGKDILAQEGVSRPRLALALLRLSLGWCIPPHEAVRYRLYATPARALDYVFDHENSSFHQRRGGAGARADALLLADKLRFAELALSAGLPAVPTLASVPAASDTSLASRLAREAESAGSYFCKTRHGNRGLGAFAAWATPDGLRGTTFDGRDLESDPAVEAAWHDLLAIGEALIQPRLTSHPALLPLIEGEDVATLRYISQRTAQGYRCLGAFLELQAGRDGRGKHPVYSIWPIDAEGTPGPLPSAALRVESARQRVQALAPRITALGQVPGWAEVDALSRAAHRQLPGLWAIAWDWAITAQGPVLLEGNSAWGLAGLQMLRGGILGAGKDESAPLAPVPGLS